MQDKEFAAILENIRSDFRAFKEGLDLVNYRVDETNKRLDETNKRIEETNKELRDLSKFLQGMLLAHDNWIKDHEVRLHKLEERIAS